MVICPWCGTVYDTFLSNCKNCGGPTQVWREVDGDEVITAPPLPPRAISDNYAWKLMLGDTFSIVGMVFALLGGIFSLVGIILTMVLVTAFVGVPFAFLGMIFLAVGGALVYSRYQDHQRVVDVLKYGEAVRGEIVDVQENLMVRVNHRHPWVIGYQFRLNGQVYGGSVTTFQKPTEQLRRGKPVYILYMPDAPHRNALYPHP